MKISTPFGIKEIKNACEDCHQDYDDLIIARTKDAKWIYQCDICGCEWVEVKGLLSLVIMRW